MRTFHCIILLAIVASIFCKSTYESQLNKTLNALQRTVEYMNDAVSAINLDAVFSIRRLEEQLEALLEYEPEVFRGNRHQLTDLQNKARIIADKGSSLVLKEYPEYASMVGFLLMRSPQSPWYPSRSTSESLVEEPVSCEKGKFNEKKNDQCLSEINGSRYNNENLCGISSDCIEYQTIRKQRDWRLTHQVLYWELAEQWNCTNGLSKSLRDRLCSNVMRDAKMVEEANFPSTHHDLFLEQIGLCGIWGYKDFNKPEWLEKILEWQDPSGCYSSAVHYKCFETLVTTEKIRVKREEKRLADGCLSHETAVALLALVANVRFEAEKDYEMNNPKLFM